MSRTDDPKTILLRTLDNGALSRTERRALQALAEAMSEDERAVFRAHAFDVAREARWPKAQIFDSLEAVNKALRVRGPVLSHATAHFSPGEGCRHRIQGLLRSAQRTADVCVFTITDDRIADEIQAAHARGVRVRIISDDRKSADRGSDVDDLRFEGLEVRIDHSPAHMHHKFAIFDDRQLLTGSYNWTRSAFTQTGIHHQI